MKAVSYERKEKMAVGSHLKPKLKAPTDAILRVTTSGICGSDLHMCDGRTPLKKGTVVGHEVMGVIEEAGEAVSSIKQGDRVVLPFNISCGFCHNCHRGYTHACLTTKRRHQQMAVLRARRRNLRRYLHTGLGSQRVTIATTLCSC